MQELRLARIAERVVMISSDEGGTKSVTLFKKRKSKKDKKKKNRDEGSRCSCRPRCCSCRIVDWVKKCSPFKELNRCKPCG